MSRLFTPIACLMLSFAIPSGAQVRGGGGFGHGVPFGGGHPAAPMPAPSGGLTIGFRAHDHGNFGRRFSGAPFLGYPAYYADYPYEPPAAAQPQIIVVQPAAPPAVQPKEDPKPPVPLMIERRGDRFVRYRGSGAADSNDPLDKDRTDNDRLDKDRPENDRQRPSQSAKHDAGHAQSGSHPSRFAAASDLESKPADVQSSSPVLLVLRDGRREEATSYAIINGVLYKYANQWNGHSWAEKILLSELDLPGTIRANKERGVDFALPAAPNEIITRP
jgi:hypothetical protein